MLRENTWCGIVLKGHDFSRAAKSRKESWALAPAKSFLTQQSNQVLFPQPV
jgi:hypothetical protein